MNSNGTSSGVLTPQEALIYAMFAAAASDRTVSQPELLRINSMVAELPAFRSLGGDWMSREAQDCGRLLSKPDGMGKVVQMIVDALSPDLRETAYALAAEVASSDLAIKDGEREFLKLLEEALQLDPLLKAALEKAAVVRHRSIPEN
ncbi:tellurite resistance TerB family protein [Hyphomicrobium sulfonivorans]|uniref:tellurite resistance TerB family protein n=1 Tax=Hyphomicrobium sulfonivorans TaxID=121290 RepID=UPI0015712775|nr:tellurite resistance TerB family protein [Hyphomicrobium sulfonivorans]MBI1649658.1 tellurite resistance TerB family protein [Hyphomicrobium sulfonivorans]